MTIGPDIREEICDGFPTRFARAFATTEAADAHRLARAAGWKITISARSGETEDHWLADLAAGWGGDQIKVGSINRSERLAKYNRPLAIEAETKWPVVKWPR